MTLSELEAAALDAHTDGTRWITFRRKHNAAIAAANRGDPVAHGRLVGTLLRLLTTGERSREHPSPVASGDDGLPWLRDDDQPAEPDGTITHDSYRRMATVGRGHPPSG